MRCRFPARRKRANPVLALHEQCHSENARTALVRAFCFLHTGFAFNQPFCCSVA
jgi:hypothetical protein